jgi:hypothetical protein
MCQRMTLKKPYYTLLHQLTKWYKVVLEDKSCFTIEENLTRLFIQNLENIFFAVSDSSNEELCPCHILLNCYLVYTSLNTDFLHNHLHRKIAEYL